MELNREYSALLGIVRAVIRGETLPHDILNGVDEEKLCLLAREQYLIGFLYRVCYEAGFSRKVQRIIENLYFATFAQQKAQESFAEEIFGYFQEHGIRYMPLKGHVIRPLYQEPMLRLSCDLDVFYDRKYRKTLRKHLLSNGFALVEKRPYHDGYVRRGVSFEPHHSLSEENAAERSLYKNIWSRLQTEDGIAYHFSPEDFYIYMLLHMRKHLSEAGGVGIRAILDLYVWQNAHPHMDTAYLEERYRYLGICQFVSSMEALSRIWFREDAPTEDMELLGAYICGGSAWGTSERRFTMTATGKTGGGKGSYILRRIFPPYRYMQKHWPLLHKAPFLLPLFWVIRWFAFLFSGKSCHLHRYLAETDHVSENSTDEIRKIRKIAGLERD